MRILLIEDNPGDARLITELLRENAGRRLVPERCDFVHVTRLDDGLTRLSRERFDIILLDLSLPDAKGLPTLQRTRDVTKEIPIVVMTGLDDESTALGALKEGAQDYLVKEEVTKAWLIRALRYAVERAKMDERRKQLETHLHHMEKLQSLAVMAGGVAHDFNNLLHIVLGHVGFLKDHTPKTEPARKNVDKIEQATIRAAGLARQMLTYAGQGKGSVEQVDLEKVVGETIRVISAYKAGKTEIRFAVPTPIPPVRGDPAQLRQALMNLITNAIEASMSSRSIVLVKVGTFEASREYLASTYVDDSLPPGTYAMIEVADSGVGMDSQTLSKAFDPFFTTKTPGRGLGLAAVLGIVRGHSGAIKIVSEPDRGTQVRVLIPPAEVLDSRVLAQMTTLPGIEELQPQAGGIILVVDDEKEILELAREALECESYGVITASSGEEAVRLFKDKSDQIGLILLDLTMPRMNGEQVFDQVKAIRPSVRVVLSSGYTEEEATRRFQGRGITAFLHKPYQMIELSNVIRAALERTS